MARFTEAEKKAIYFAVGYVLEQQGLDGDMAGVTDSEWKQFENIQRKLTQPVKQKG